MTLDGLRDVTIDMAEQAFEMSCGIKPEWGRWSVRPGENTEDMIKANMIFAVRPQNIRTIPKVISLLGRISVIVALSPKETPRQCSQYGECPTKKKIMLRRPAVFSAIAINMKQVIMFIWRRSAKMVLQYALTRLNALYATDRIEQTSITAH